MSAHNKTKFICAVCKRRTVRRGDEQLKGVSTKRKYWVPYPKHRWGKECQQNCIYCRCFQKVIEVPIRKKVKGETE